MANKAIGYDWEEVKKDLFTPEEIHKANARADFICAFIKARKESGFTQKELEKVSGVKQPVIARMETGATNPTLDTVLKLLSSMGMELAVVPAKTGKQF